MPQPCAAVCKNGQPCRIQVLVDGRYCFAHAPAHAAKRAEARARGGKHRANAARLQRLVPPRLVPVFSQLEGALVGVLEGTVEPAQGTSAAAIARAMCAVMSTAELEQRVRDLEAGIEKGRKP